LKKTPSVKEKIEGFEAYCLTKEIINSLPPVSDRATLNEFVSSNVNVVVDDLVGG